MVSIRRCFAQQHRRNNTCVVWLLLLSFSLLIGACSEKSGSEKNGSEKSKDAVKPLQKNHEDVAHAVEELKAATGNNQTVTSNDSDNTLSPLSYDEADLSVLDISERSREGKNAIAVTLSAPLDPAVDFQSYFNISAKDGGVVDGGWELDDSNKLIWFTHTQPNTRYQIIVYQGLTSVSGKELSTTATREITTRDLKPSVNFDTSGAFLTKGLGSGLPIVAVNIDAVDIDFFKVKDDKLSTFINNIRNNDNYYYYGLEYITKLAKLTYSARYDLEVPENTRVTRHINIQGNEQLNTPGVYFAVLRTAGEYRKKQVVWFSVTDLGLHARHYENKLDVYVSSLNSGKAMKGITVSLLDNQNRLIQQSNTSPQGLASFRGDLSNATLAVARDKEHISLIELKKPALDLSEFDLGSRPQLPVEAFIYTPRDLFRPGEIADFNALLRDFDGKKTHSPVLKVKIRRPNGSVAKEFNWSYQIPGYYHYAWSIPSDAPVGNWEFVIDSPLKTRKVYTFKVEEFLPERLKLSYNPNKTQRDIFSTTDTISVDVLGEYLYGAPADNNRLSTLVNINHWRSPLEEFKDFQFGNIQETQFNQQLSLDDTNLNSEGETTLTLASQWQQSKSPLRIIFTNSLYESGGRPVSRTHSALVWPGKSHIGIRPHFGDKNPEANSRVKFDIVNANNQGQLQAVDNLAVTLVREDRQYFWSFTEHRGWHWDWTDKEYPEHTQSLNITSSKYSTLELPVSYGSYRLEIRNAEQGTLSSVRFYAGYNWYRDWQNAQYGSGAVKPDRVTIALDKEKYKAGDIAKATIIPPEASEALVMVEGDGPLWTQRVSLDAKGSEVSIPISDSWQQHNLYISVVALQSGSQQKKITPKRSFGLHHLALEREHRRLTIDIDTPEKALPEKTLMANIQVNNQNTSNKSSQVHVTLAAVDVGVLSISNFKTPDPHDAFFGQRRYNIDVKDMYHKVIELSDAPQARLRFGGDEDLQRGGNKPQSDVQIVSLFSGIIDVNADGQAQIPLNIPDFNGRIRLMALAFNDDSFGHAEQDVTIAAPIVTQIAMPRYLATGDESFIALDVRNLSGEKQTVSVTMESDGPIQLVNNKTNQNITLDHQQKHTFSYPVKAVDYQGAATFNLQVSGENIESFSRQWKLGVRPAYPALITDKRAVLEQGESFALSPDEFPETLPGTLQGLISTSSLVELAIEEQLKNLIRYPYGCLEQTTSRIFPLTFASQKNQNLFNIKTVSDSKRMDMIEKGLDRISSLQLNNGGFGLWDNRSPEQHWLTAYVADFLTNARDMGIAIPQSLLDKAMRRLKKYVKRQGSFIGERWSYDSDHYRFAYKAYAAYVLSKVNQAPLGALRTLHDKHLKDAQSGLSQIQLGIALVKMGDKKRGNSAIEKGLKNFSIERRYWGDYGSLVRDYSMAIHILLSDKLFIKEAQALSLDLAEAIRERRWFSTQERSAMFLAGIALAPYANQTWGAEFIINASKNSPSQEDKTFSVDKKGSYKKRFNEDELLAGVSITSKHDGVLFVNSQVQGFSTQAPESVENGFEIERTWYNREGELVTPSKVQVGDLFIVHLKVDAERRRPDALVVDLLPAGFELENQNLEHAIKLDNFKIEGESIESLQKYTEVQYQEYRDDRYVAAVDMRRQSTHLFYLVRAVTPGTYKVPSPFVEDMYQPEKHAIGETLDSITIENAASVSAK